MKKLKAFSLLEVMIVLAIAGIMLVSISQGYKLIQKAKIQKTTAQISLICNAYSSNPSTSNNNAEIWNHLISTDTLDKKDQLSSLGGIFIFENGYLILAKNENKEGLLSFAQAKQIKQQIDSSLDNNEGIVHISPEPIENNENNKYILTIKI